MLQAADHGSYALTSNDRATRIYHFIGLKSFDSAVDVPRNAERISDGLNSIGLASSAVRAIQEDAASG
jgi:hypothetical protein